MKVQLFPRSPAHLPPFDLAWTLYTQSGCCRIKAHPERVLPALNIHTEGVGGNYKVHSKLCVTGKRPSQKVLQNYVNRFFRGEKEYKVA